jgi:hypothetical protein
MRFHIAMTGKWDSQLLGLELISLYEVRVLRRALGRKIKFCGVVAVVYQAGCSIVPGYLLLPLRA